MESHPCQNSAVEEFELVGEEMNPTGSARSSSHLSDNGKAEILEPVSVKNSPPNVKPGMGTIKRASMSPPKNSMSSSSSNPLPTFGASTHFMDKLTCFIPDEHAMYGTIKDLTRGKWPTSRFWKWKITFKHGSYTSMNIMFDRVPISFASDTNHGSNKVYIGFPTKLREVLQESLEGRYNVKLDDAGLEPTSEFWWKTAYEATDKIGVVNPATKQFEVISIPELSLKPREGIYVNLQVKMFCKASTPSKEDLSIPVHRTISVDIVRAYIVDFCTDINPLFTTRFSVGTGDVPILRPTDFADQTVLQRLSMLAIS